ncbi:helix-hairpin-helix domain-containing protein [Lacticigenium naphthae]|uniref:helix-hairpin-helix domain-containing protein n=1 Tax=Lacticigenium naphthae TaxID=515351 RepID=UPI0012EBC952|nr:helix-hairpin-helix domain-containing protein [Lacticigenium naphthae]
MIKLWINSYSTLIKTGVIGIFFVIMIFFLSNIFEGEENKIGEVQLITEQKLESTEIESEPTELIIDVKGAVKSPGIYSFEDGTRIYQAIEKAGGVTEEANTETINLAQLLTDQMLLYIPNQEEINENTIFEGEASDQKISLNRATATELTALPGIGEKKANQIIQYREEVGSFKTIEEIMNVTGIGDKTFEAIKEMISL